MFASIQQRRGLEWTGETETETESDGSVVIGTNTFGGVCSPVRPRVAADAHAPRG